MFEVFEMSTSGLSLKHRRGDVCNTGWWRQ